MGGGTLEVTRMVLYLCVTYALFLFSFSFLFLLFFFFVGDSKCTYGNIIVDFTNQ